jgi:protein-tyrosine kinase
VSIIEKATKRLEELRRSGIDVPPWSSASELPGVGRDGPAPHSSGSTPSVPPIASLYLAPPTTKEPERQSDPKHVSRQVSLDFAHLGRIGLLDPTAPRSSLADELRVIKRPIIANARGDAKHKRGNLIMVTSTVPGEGKSFISINLSLSIAMEFDSQVLLVDADTVRPAVLDRLGLPTGAPGLLDRLEDPTRNLSDLILRTNIDRLALLPSGSSKGHATEMLASAGMDKFLDELSSRYPDRIIIFDAPPLLPSTEARVLANWMGQVVLVVEAGRTTQSMVKEALATVEACPIVMTMLNKWRGFGGALGGYGYYGY